MEEIGKLYVSFRAQSRERQRVELIHVTPLTYDEFRSNTISRTQDCATHGSTSASRKRTISWEILYNELTARGLNVDVGVVEYDHIVGGKKIRTPLEVDFVVNLADRHRNQGKDCNIPGVRYMP